MMAGSVPRLVGSVCSALYTGRYNHMFRTLSNSWALVKASYAVLRADRELLVFPVVSMMGLIIFALVFSIPLFLRGEFGTVSRSDGPADSQNVLGWALTLMFYLATYTVIVYSN